MPYLFIAQALDDAAATMPGDLQGLKDDSLIRGCCNLQELELISEGRNAGSAGCLYQGSLDAVSLQSLNVLAGKEGFDLLYLNSVPELSKPGCLIMDMDMTAVTIEGIDEIARSLGVYDKVAALTASAMHGRTDFATSLRQRVALLAGGSASVLDEVRARMHETPGLSLLLTFLKQHGFKCAIASGGFTQLIGVLEQRYGLDLVRANTLEIENGRFTGRVVGDIVDGVGKERALLELRWRFNIEHCQSIALGDGANDLKMLRAAGLGIAYHAKPEVAAALPCSFKHCNLSALALLLELYAEAGC